MHAPAHAAAKAESFAAICICSVTRMVRGCPRHAPAEHATHESVHAMLIRILENQGVIMSELSQQQTDVNAAAAAITSAETVISTVAADLGTVLSNVQAQLAALQTANPAVDTSALDTAVAGLSAPLAALQAADAALDAIETPAAPAAPAEPSAPVASDDTQSAS